MQKFIIYRPGNPGPAEIDGIDPDGIVVVGVDWSQALSDEGLVGGIDESTWHPSAGILVGDGVAVVSRKGKVATPPAPSTTVGEYVDTIPASLTLAHIYVDDALPGTYVEVSNHIKAGSLMDEVTLRMLVQER